MAVVVLDGTLRADKLELGRGVDPSALDVLHEARDTVESVALDAIKAAVRMDLGALRRLLFAEPRNKERLLYRILQFVIRDAQSHR